MAEEILGEWNRKRIAFKIVDIIDKELQTCLGHKNKKLIMGEKKNQTPYWPLICQISFLPRKAIITMQKIVVRMHSSLVVSWPLPWACNQNKGMDRCGRRVQPRNHIHTLRSVKECEGMSPHTPMWTPTLGVKVFMDFWMFREQFEGVKTHWIEKFLRLLKNS